MSRRIFDDAVLSCGQYLDATRDHDTYVYTAMSAIPPAGTATGYDLSTGWPDSPRAIVGRRREDSNALGILGCHQVLDDHLFDGQYDPAGSGARQMAVAVRARELLRSMSPDLVIVPVGIKHPDHVAVADGWMTALANPGPSRVWDSVEHVLLYEEQPYRVMHPDLVPARLDRWRLALGEFDVEAQPAGDMAVKQTAVAQYASQIVALEPDLPCCWVPERFHRLRSTEE